MIDKIGFTLDKNSFLKVVLSSFTVLVASLYVSSLAFATETKAPVHDQRMAYLYLVFGVILLVLLIWVVIAALKKK